MIEDRPEDEVLWGCAILAEYGRVPSRISTDHADEINVITWRIVRLGKVGERKGRAEMKHLLYAILAVLAFPLALVLLSFAQWGSTAESGIALALMAIIALIVAGANRDED